MPSEIDRAFHQLAQAPITPDELEGLATLREKLRARLSAKTVRLSGEGNAIHITIAVPVSFEVIRLDDAIDEGEGLPNPNQAYSAACEAINNHMVIHGDETEDGLVKVWAEGYGHVYVRLTDQQEN